MKAEEAIQILKTWRIAGDEAHEALDMAIEALAKDINVPINDCISREAAIDALIEGFKRSPTIAIRAKDMIEQLPSAQPEIIHCKECKFAHMTYDGDCKYCDVWFPDESAYLDGDYYCASAERRTDGQNN